MATTIRHTPNPEPRPIVTALQLSNVLAGTTVVDVGRTVVVV